MTKLTRARRELLRDAQLGALRVAPSQFLENLGRPQKPATTAQECYFLSRLGKGGFGSVFKARHGDNQIVAVKLHMKDVVRERAGRIAMVINERIFQEALFSNFVPSFFGTFRTQNWLGLLMEFAPYGDLKRVFRHGRGITEKEALDYVPQIICGLEYLHSVTLIYGDLKPENCLIFAKGRLKLSDFGLTQIARDDLNAVRGTLPYMAPEILRAEFYDDGIDWWALGVLIFKLLLNTYPFHFGPDDDGIQGVDFERKGNIDDLRRSSLTGEAKDLISGLLTMNRRERLGSGAAGVQEIQKHLWFRDTDFVRVRSDDFEVVDFKWDEVEGSPCDPDFLHHDEAKELDPQDAEFERY